MDFEQLLKNIAEFPARFGQGYNGPPRELPASLAALRVKVMMEEVSEIALAYNRGELDEQLDAYADVFIALIVSVAQSGMLDVFPEAIRRVHNANMQKILAPSRHASKRDSAWDIIKPEGWVKPDLTDLVRREQ